MFHTYNDIKHLLDSDLREMAASTIQKIKDGERFGLELLCCIRKEQARRLKK